MLSTRVHRVASIACITLTALCLTVAGCESQPTRTAEGPPPAGYATWDEYYEATDKGYRDTDSQLDQRRQQRDPVAPRPY